MNNPAGKAISAFTGLYGQAASHLLRLEFLVLLAIRLTVARVFWLSGLGKVNTIDIGPVRIPTLDLQNSTKFAFRSEFFPELPRDVAELLAFFAALGELTLPLLLVFGFLTRIGAAGLLVMTMVIQIFVFPDAWWNVHIWWTLGLLVLLVRGPGWLSVDNRIGLETKRD